MKAKRKKDFHSTSMKARFMSFLFKSSGVGQETLLHIGITDELQVAWQGWEG
jgi:hypothetical protein